MSSHHSNVQNGSSPVVVEAKTPGSCGSKSSCACAKKAKIANWTPATRAIRGGLEPDPVTGAVTPSIVQSTTFVQKLGVPQEFAYSRVGNPTVAALEKTLGALENAPQGVAFATGLAAEHALFTAFLGKTGDHVVVSRVVYGGTVRLLDQIFAPYGVTTTYVDTTDAENVRKAIIPGKTKVVFIESPGNPTLELADIRGIAKVCQEAGVPLVVDNTFLTAAVQQPLELGATVSLYSTTKYIEGHNSTVGGAIITRDEKLLEKFRWVRKCLGSIQSPQEAFLTIRGIKTLPFRMARHSENAQLVAEFLESHPAVERVHYPGLASFPQRDLADAQHIDGQHGGIVTFEVHGGVEAGKATINALELCLLAENLGAVETLVTHSATMTHADVPRERRLAVGITDGLIRISVGLEDPRDIIADLEQALAAAAKVAGIKLESEVTA